MQTELIIRGVIAGMKKQEYKGAISYRAQFLIENDGLDLLNVKIDEEFFNERLKKGVEVVVPVKISTMDNKIFYKVVSPIKFNK